MIQLEQAKTHAKAANKVALDVEKEKDDTEQEVQRLQHLLKIRELEHMLELSMTTRSVIRSHRTTGTSKIIVVRLHTFKTATQLLSTLTQKFQLRRKVRRTRWSILDWDLWDGLLTGVWEIVLLL